MKILKMKIVIKIIKENFWNKNLNKLININLL